MVCCVMLCFFFFKQKTAYEMRISDWSSDVCSSDLLEGHERHPGVAARTEGQHVEAGEGHHILDGGVFHELLGDRAGELLGPRQRSGWRQEIGIDQDRKSVVSGKSVSVRVDLGGRRIIKKKKKR